MITVTVCLSVLQVLQLQALQSFQNKAVPAAALLFVHVERAHSLPVSPSGLTGLLVKKKKKEIRLILQ